MKLHGREVVVLRLQPATRRSFVLYSHCRYHTIMKFASSVFASLVVGGARAFAPRPALRTFSTTRTALHANVLKLSDPQKELLDKVDVFIFDCDGVIWRVSCLSR